MGTATYTTECGPDGDTIVYLHATNSWTTVYVDGEEIHDTNGDGTADTITGPGVHTIEWWGPSSHDPNVLVLLNVPTILDIPALTDCAPTTTPVPPTVPEATSTTALVPPSTIPFGHDCPAPIFDNNEWQCPPATDIATTVNTIEVTDSTLPATGGGETAMAVGFAGVLLVFGTLCVLAARRVTS